MKQIIKILSLTFLFAIYSIMMASANNGKEVQTSEIREQPFGEYLAGQHAATHYDLRSAADYHEKALALDSDNQMILRKSFTIFIADGRYDAARKAAHKLAEMDITDSQIQMFLLLEKLNSGDYGAALSQLDVIGDAGVYGIFKPLFRSWILLAQGNDMQAEENMQQVLQSKGFQDFKKFHGGLFYTYLGKTQLAEELYAGSLAVPGGASIRTIEAYGILLRHLGREQDARQLYVNFLEKAPDNAKLQRAIENLDNDVRPVSYISSTNDGIAEVFFSAANFLMQDNIRMPATAYLRYGKYLKQPFFSADYLLGQIFVEDKYFDGAIANFSRIPPDHPMYFNARLQMAWTYEKMGELDKAIKAMEKLAVEFPANGVLLGALGDINRMHRRFEAAGRAYSKYIDDISEPKKNHWSLFYTRGIAYEQAKKWPLAEADFLKALELYPDQPQVLNYLAYSWVDKNIHVEKARKMLERAVELRPNDGYIIDSLGWALYRLGDMKQAVEYLERAVLLQTNDWAINDHLGDAYWAVGRRYEAKFQWRHALSLKPDAELMAKIRIKIRDGK